MSRRRAAKTANVQHRVDVSSLGRAALQEFAEFVDCRTPAELNEVLLRTVRTEVSAIERLIADADAFDVVELMRLREMPPVPVAGLRNGFDGLAAAIEIISLVLLARGSRVPTGGMREDARPHEVIPQLHERATKLVRLATFKLAAEGAIRSAEPLARIAAEYQSHVMAVRSMQYSTFHDPFNCELFDNEAMRALMRETLGFTYAEFDTVRREIASLYSEKITAARDLLAEVAAEWDGGAVQPGPQRIAQARQATIDFLFLPGDRAAFRAEEIAVRAGIDPAQVTSVISAFSSMFDESQNATERIVAFLRGSNPLARRPLLVDADGNCVMTSVQIGVDSLRRVVEDALKQNQKHWKRYDKIRMEVSERLAIDYVEKALQTPATHRGLKYFAPKSGVEPAELSASCGSPTDVGELAEADGLFLVEDVGICIEVKARSISEQARRGDIVRLGRELDNTIGSAAGQARRLERLIETNAGLWLEDRTWLDLSFVREVRSIAVGLDDYGPLGVALDELRRSGVITDDKLPWVTSLHDLATICTVIDRPTELLLYIRRRSDSGVAKYYRATDELDLFMLFLHGGLYVEPDPDAIHRLYPGPPPPTNRERRNYARSAQPVRVATFTDELDAWFYAMEGSNPFPATKPTFNCHPWAAELVDFLADGRKPGWFRFGTDLLSLSGASQRRLGVTVRMMVKQTRTDGLRHQLQQGYAGNWGYPTLFVQTRPDTQPRTNARDVLRIYMAAKKHQLQSDRAIGLLVSEAAEIECVLYLNNPPAPSPELDALGEQIGLRPPGETTRVPWPSAPTRKQREKPKSKARRRK